jgi:hypothetical protein
MYLTKIKTLCKIQTCEGFGENAQGDDDYSGHTVYLVRYSHDVLPNGIGEDEEID